MRIMLDTNVLISAFVFGGRTGKLMNILLASEHRLYVSEYVDLEFKAKLEAKWPDLAKKVYVFYHRMDICFCESTDQKLGELRDEKDIPVLSDAIYNNIDLILTGDKDFLDARLKHPLVFSPSMMLEYIEQR
jgi:putative PIN family toxin of toxin-antitoxin system